MAKMVGQRCPRCGKIICGLHLFVYENGQRVHYNCARSKSTSVYLGSQPWPRRSEQTRPETARKA